MELKEKVVSFSETRNAIEFVDKEIKSVFEKYDAEIAELKLKKEELSKKLDTTFSLIEEEIKAEFEKNPKVKKFIGGFGIQERKNFVYDSKLAFDFAKEKGIFLKLDEKSFEKAIEGLNLDFVKEEKVVKVTVPKVISLED